MATRVMSCVVSVMLSCACARCVHRFVRARSHSQAIEVAESRAKPPLDTLFTDVYDKMPRHLEEQAESLRSHLEKYPQK